MVRAASAVAMSAMCGQAQSAASPTDATTEEEAAIEGPVRSSSFPQAVLFLPTSKEEEPSAGTPQAGLEPIKLGTAALLRGGVPALSSVHDASLSRMRRVELKRRAVERKLWGPLGCFCCCCCSTFGGLGQMLTRDNTQEFALAVILGERSGP